MTAPSRHAGLLPGGGGGFLLPPSLLLSMGAGGELAVPGGGGGRAGVGGFALALGARLVIGNGGWERRRSGREGDGCSRAPRRPLPRASEQVGLPRLGRCRWALQPYWQRMAWPTTRLRFALR